jgi:hypothetical protein
MQVRTKWVRDVLTDALWSGVAQLFRYVKYPERLKKVALTYLKNNPEILRDELEKSLKAWQISKAQMDSLCQIAYQLAPHYLDATSDELTTGLEAVHRTLEERLPIIKKQSHVKVLRRGLVPPARINLLRRLHWFLLLSEQPHLILGDFGPLSLTSDHKRFKVLPDKDDRVDALFLPISQRHLVVASNTQACPRVDFEEINLQTAEHSDEYFVASSNNLCFQKYSAAIGKNAKIVPDSELAQIISQTLGDLSGASISESEDAHSS